MHKKHRPRMGFYRSSCFAVLWALNGMSTVGLGQEAPPRIQVRRVTEAPTQPKATSGVQPRIESRLIDALGRNPETIGARVTGVWRENRVVLKGRVATARVHDTVVQTAIDLGLPIVDELVIDTAEVVYHARPALVSPIGPTALPDPQAGWGGGSGPGLAFGPRWSYLYPPPLLGRYDDPFFGFEPPVISYPPDWAARAARRVDVADARRPSPGPGLPDGTVIADVDPNGVAVLRGRVPTMADRVAVGQTLSQTQGVTEVINLLEVAGTPQGQVPANPQGDQPPPPPQPPSQTPVQQAPDPERPGLPIIPPPPAPGVPAAAASPNPLEDRVRQSLKSVPALREEPIRLQVRDGIVTVSGRLTSAYEAMLAYRSVQKTPGVREVVDLLQFPLPEENGPNPLIQHGRPDDIEPYLLVQFRRNLDDLANVDRVSVVGDTLTLQGTLAEEADRPRFFAILRSMPLLRGFKVSARMTAVSP